MPDETKPAAIEATSVPPSRATRGYPEPFAARVAGRERRALGDAFGLTNFGVNLTRLPPGSMSALRHTHMREDEFIYIIKGTRSCDKPGRNAAAPRNVRRLQSRLGRRSSPAEPHWARRGLSGSRRPQSRGHRHLPRR